MKISSLVYLAGKISCVAKDISITVLSIRKSEDRTWKLYYRLKAFARRI